VGIAFDLASFFLVVLIELLSGQSIRQASVVVFAVLMFRLRIESRPKFTWTSDAKRLLGFFAVNFAFMFVEFWVGLSTNSLGLLSDAFHMLCDNVSLFYSAMTALLSRQPPTAQFPYGFARLELVTSFTNGVLLLYIALNLLAEAISRLIQREDVGGDYLVLTSVLGLLVNLAGLCFTNDTSGENVFLRSIFLHVLVDTLGSIGVILSSICVMKFGIFICDSICSALISLSILGTAIPLVRDVVRGLMLTAPDGIGPPEVSGFGCVERWACWSVKNNIVVMTVKIRLTRGAEVASSLWQVVVRHLREKGILDATIEIVT
jgi:cation diffusion facilitator family transporter